MLNGIPLHWYLIVAAALFCIGLYGVLARKNAIAVLMGVELMLNAVNINLIAFWRYISPNPNAQTAGLAFTAFVFVVAAAEAAVGLALIISVYRSTQSVDPEKLDQMKL